MELTDTAHLGGGQALMRKCKALLTENKELGEEMREDWASSTKPEVDLLSSKVRRCVLPRQM